ncbi:hypothetical protein ACJD0Z_06825 [Flavobacteriaceae bacterium M23B6Z8]
MKVRSFKYVFVLILMISASCFQYEPKKNNEIKKKQIVLPEGAFHVDSAHDQGVWVFLEWIHAHKNNATIAIYEGVTKELLLRKRFILVCASSPDKFIWIENPKEQIVCYEKGKLLFSEPHCWLQ